MRRLTTALALAAFLAAVTLSTAVAAKPASLITLTGATSAEGIAGGPGNTFYAGDLFQGDIYRGDLRSGAVAIFRDAPAGRMALGMKVDQPDHLLFVAGGGTGQAYVYDTRTGGDVAVLNLANPATGPFINDVVVANGAAWFTDSAHPVLYRVSIGANGTVGTPSTLTLTGPAAGITGSFNLNGIGATADGRTLVVSHTTNGALYTVNPATGASAAISGAGAGLPNVDGILMEAGRLWAVQNSNNQVSVLRLAPDHSSATVEQVITSPLFETPTAVARHGDQLAVVNAKFDTGFPPTAASYDVAIVPAH